MLRKMSPPPRIFIYATGAGAGIQQRIWEVPGCSSYLIGCGFPYDADCTNKYIGYKQNKFVSLNVSLELAMAAYLQAYKSGHKAIGIGLTASVASVIPHRGAHRIIASYVSETECQTFEVELPKAVGLKARLQDGEIADDIGITMLLKAAGLNNSLNENKIFGGIPMEFKLVDTTTDALKVLLSSSYFLSDGSRSTENKIDQDKVIFYPGSFNPFHFGHAEGATAMQQTAAKEFGSYREVVFTTVINPMHKPILSLNQILNRIAMMRGKNFCLTINDPLFINKAEKHPGGWFGMGIDTLISMLDPKWGYPTIEILDRLLQLKTKIFVLGRNISGNYVTLHNLFDQLIYLNKYKDLFVEVSGRWDVSSTELRAQFS